MTKKQEKNILTCYCSTFKNWPISSSVRMPIRTRSIGLANFYGLALARRSTTVFWPNLQPLPCSWAQGPTPVTGPPKRPSVPAVAPAPARPQPSTAGAILAQPKPQHGLFYNPSLISLCMPPARRTGDEAAPPTHVASGQRWRGVAPPTQAAAAASHFFSLIPCLFLCSTRDEQRRAAMARRGT